MPTEGHRVLLTGAAGRIGQPLLAGLADLGHAVTGCDIVEAPGVVLADCLDIDRMTELCRGKVAVLHFAGIPNGDGGWEHVRRLNLDGLQVTLEAAARSGVRRFIFASSIHTVGALPADTPLSPDLPPAPSGIYGALKLAGEALLRVYAAKAGMSCIALRVLTCCPEPRNARELRTWLSLQDAVHLVDRSVRSDFDGYRMAWGVSANARIERNDPVATEIGYHPSSNAEVHADRLRGAGVDTTLVSEWMTLGGRMTGERDIAK